MCKEANIMILYMNSFIINDLFSCVMLFETSQSGKNYINFNFTPEVHFRGLFI